MELEHLMAKTKPKNKNMPGHRIDLQATSKRIEYGLKNLKNVDFD